MTGWLASLLFFVVYTNDLCTVEWKLVYFAEEGFSNLKVCRNRSTHRTFDLFSTHRDGSFVSASANTGFS